MKAPAIQIGASPQSIKEAREAIMAILTSQNAEKVKSDALAAFVAVCEVKGTTITNCEFKS